MHNTLAILRAIVRLSRQNSNISIEALTERSSGTPTQTRSAVRFLVEEGLVNVTERGIRPTLPGLAIAVASGAQAKHSGKPASVSRIGKKADKKVDRAHRAA